MSGENMKILRSFGLAFLAVVGGQLAGAQRLKPIPHAIGAPGRAQARAAVAVASAQSSPWTPLTNQPNFLADGAPNPILLTDGTVLIQDAAFPDWWRLTPDQSGSYVNGTCPRSPLRPMATAPCITLLPCFLTGG